jgi:hypothetical protein
MTDSKETVKFTTVKQLIQLLQACDPKAIVVTNAMDGDMHRRFPIRVKSVVDEPGWIDKETGEHMYIEDDDHDDNQNGYEKARVVILNADS